MGGGRRREEGREEREGEEGKRGRERDFSIHQLDERLSGV